MSLRGRRAVVVALRTFITHVQHDVIDARLGQAAEHPSSLRCPEALLDQRDALVRRTALEPTIMRQDVNDAAEKRDIGAGPYRNIEVAERRRPPRADVNQRMPRPCSWAIGNPRWASAILIHEQDAIAIRRSCVNWYTHCVLPGADRAPGGGQVRADSRLRQFPVARQL